MAREYRLTNLIDGFSALIYYCIFVLYFLIAKVTETSMSIRMCIMRRNTGPSYLLWFVHDICLDWDRIDIFIPRIPFAKVRFGLQCPCNIRV